MNSVKVKENAKELQSAQQALYRRLGPIQDAFYEQKNYKSVVKTCEASLKKDPNQPHVKTYLAMAKQQLGDVEEALEVYESLLALVKPNDPEFAVRLLKQALDFSGQLELYAQALEVVSAAAVKSGSLVLPPDALKVETLLFHQYFRLGEFQKATKQAMRLKQLAGEDGQKAFKMLMWNIVATFWTYKSTGSAMSLTLCERMLAKLVDEGKLTSGEDVLFYCAVLKAAGKPADALQIAKGSLGAKAFPFEEERLKLICSLTEAAKDRLALREAFLNVLRVSSDDWDAWNGLLDASDDMAAVVATAHELGQSNRGKRGPKLAEIEACVRSGKAGLLGLLIKYFAEFGHKACFWGDVARYALMLGEEEKRTLLQELKALLRPVDWQIEYPPRAFSALELEDPNDEHREKRDGRNLGKVDIWCPEDEARQSEMMCRVGVAKLEITLGSPSSIELVQELFRQQQAANALYGKMLLATEEGPNDDLLVVGAHHLCALGKCLDAMALCEAGLVRTPFAFQPKLLLIRLAGQSGGFGYAVDLFGRLECKNIQLDSMGHYFLYPAVQSGNFGVLEELAKCYNEFRDGTLKRTVPNDTSKCFSHQRWSQVEEFAHFGKRLDASWHACAVQIEFALAGACRASSNESDAKAALSHARRRGLIEIGVRKGLQWLEALIDACETYKGKGDLRVVYNYDLRVQADFRKCLSKSEFLAAEWVVPAEMVDWLMGRALQFKVLESSLTGDAAAVVGSAEKLLGLVGRMQASKLVGGQLSWDVYRAVLVATIKTCMCSDFAAGRDALTAVVEALGRCKEQLLSQSPFPCLVEGWAADVSFLSFELVPLIELLSSSWRKLGQPSKSAKNKLDAASKSALAEQLTQIKVVVDSSSELAKLFADLSKRCASQSDDDLLKVVLQSAAVVSEPHLRAVCTHLNAAWKTWFNLIASKCKA
jgi:tetratricopeptide (TPR) repeat protein